jgi:hypothetical protein
LCRRDSYTILYPCIGHKLGRKDQEQDFLGALVSSIFNVFAQSTGAITGTGAFVMVFMQF